jgi:hypothetical protein
MSLELVSGADLICTLHHFSSRARLEGVLGPSLAEKRPKVHENPNISVSLSATQLKVALCCKVAPGVLLHLQERLPPLDDREGDAARLVAIPEPPREKGLR